MLRKSLAIGGLALVAAVAILVSGTRMSRTPPPRERARQGLPPCPPTPNCVSSLSSDPRRRVDPLPLWEPPAKALETLQEVVDAMPRSRVVTARDGYLHAEFRSLVFRFVDDLELLVDEDRGVVQVRSASRIGAGDLGANRRRVEELRRRLERLSPSAAERHR